MTAEGLRRVAAAQSQHASQKQQQQQASLGSGDPSSAAAQGAETADSMGGSRLAGTAVPVQPAAAIHQPGSSAVFSAITAQAAAGAAAAAAAILGAPSAAAEQQLQRSLPGSALATPTSPADAGQARRAPGSGDPLQSPAFCRFLEMLRGNSMDFEAQGRVLRLRQYLRPDVGPRVSEHACWELGAES
jgi:hypothetical protein